MDQFTSRDISESPLRNVDRQLEPAEGERRRVRAARFVGEKSGCAVGYVRSTSPREMLSHLGGVVRSNPGVSLIGAVVAGLFLGRTLRA
jgi:hypothetical protein